MASFGALASFRRLERMTAYDPKQPFSMVQKHRVETS